MNAWMMLSQLADQHFRRIFFEICATQLLRDTHDTHKEATERKRAAHVYLSPLAHAIVSHASVEVVTRIDTQFQVQGSCSTLYKRMPLGLSSPAHALSIQ